MCACVLLPHTRSFTGLSLAGARCVSLLLFTSVRVVQRRVVPDAGLERRGCGIIQSKRILYSRPWVLTCGRQQSHDCFVPCSVWTHTCGKTTSGWSWSIFQVSQPSSPVPMLFSGFCCLPLGGDSEMSGGPTDAERCACACARLVCGTLGLVGIVSWLSAFCDDAPETPRAP